MIVIVPNYVLDAIKKLFCDGGYPEEAYPCFENALLNFYDENGTLPPSEQIQMTKGEK